MVMDRLISGLVILFSPIGSIFFVPAAKQYWLYLAASLIIAAVVYVGRSRKPKLRSLVHYCVPWRILLHRSAITDYKIWFLNSLLLIVIAPPLITVATGYSYLGAIGVTRFLVGVDCLNWRIGPAGIAVATLLNLLALDASLFLTHLAHHRISFLWEFHKVHHSAEVLTPFTVFRGHPVEFILNGLVFAILGGITSGSLVFVFGSNPGMTILGVNAFEFAFFLFGYHLRHSHVWIMFPGWLGRHISSPALHQIHHSADPRHYDKNLAQIFTFWDRIAGTLYLPRQRENLKFGIGEKGEDDFATLPNLYLKPFSMVMRRLFTRAT
jgi:sterol desaturase/sphingolipid hydroxylase (fatty acid hydroxylase superfamily)